MIVKICGMRDADNIRCAEQLPADWMGFIFYARSPRYVDRLPDYLPHRQKRVGVFVNASADFIAQRAELFRLDLIQLHGTETPEMCEQVRHSTGCSIVKAFGIGPDTDFDRINDYEGFADYLLFDSRSPSVGGSGTKFGHELLDHYTGHTPFLLSGGLGPDDVDCIIGCKHPRMCGIDLNSRFETQPAIKDIGKLQAFLQQLEKQTSSNQLL